MIGNMQAEVIKTFRFEAAHTLPNAPEGHKCRNLHGHGYRVDVHVTGPVDKQRGWVIDFGEIVRAVAPVIAELDHHLLNDVPGLANSTAEQIARVLFDRIAPALAGLSAVTVWESDTSRAVYRGR
jgi:6-pyruvoyltetrahydropterin/6-carboxytetrahydropterin synthase